MTSLKDYEEAFAEPPKPRTASDLYNEVGPDITPNERNQLEQLVESGDELAKSALEMQKRFDDGSFPNMATMVH